MAGYRQIHTQIWKDEWFIELDPDEKFLFIYLFSNELASISGLYKIPIRVMHNETCIPLSRVQEIMNMFVDQDKVQYADGTLWIRNMWRYHKNASARTQIKVWNDINMIPDCHVKHDCIQYLYSIGMDTLDVLKAKAKTKAKPKSESETEAKEVPDPLPPDEYKRIIHEIEKITGLPPSNKSSVDAIEEILKMSATKDDIQAGYDWICKQKKTLKYYGQLVGPTRTAMSKRLQKGYARASPHKETSMEMLDRLLEEEEDE